MMSISERSRGGGQGGRRWLRLSPVPALLWVAVLMGACGGGILSEKDTEVVVHRYPGGRLHTERVYRIRDGKRDLIQQTQYAPQGDVDRFEDFEKGILRVITRYGNGNPHEKKEFRQGVPDGIWIEWDAMGRRRKRCRYRKGKLDGTWTEWDEKGRILVTRKYRKGKPVE